MGTDHDSATAMPAQKRAEIGKAVCNKEGRED